MHIALDYDGTYTLAPGFWDSMKIAADLTEHQMFIVTKRGKDHKGIITIPGWQVFHTNLEGKKSWCERAGIVVDVWIDDDPINILLHGKIKHE